MADPYWRYSPLEARDSHGAAPGYVPSDPAALTSHHLLGAGNPQGTSSEYLPSDVLPLQSGAYSLNDLAGIPSHATPRLSGLPSGAGVRGFSPLEDPALSRRDGAFGMRPGIPDIDQADPLQKPDGLSPNESGMLFVDGLPTDCTRREVSHLFRPFIGFKEIRVIHKEPRRSGDKAQVLCFVEFTNADCAFTALEALQGYKFDNLKPDAPVLRIQFAKFPFRPPGRDGQRHADLL